MAIIISHRIKQKEFTRGIIVPDDLQTILGAFQLEADVRNGRIDVY